MAKLTTKSIENMKPAADRREVPDGGCRGLYLVVQPSGARGWAVRYRYQGKPRKLTLGVWPVLQLAAARSAASAALHELAQGRDPAALKFEAEAAAAKAEIDRKADTIESWAKHFLDRHAAKKREHTERQYRHVIEDFALPAWRGRTVHDIKRRDVINLVEGIAETKPVMANRALVVIGTFFGWLCSRDVIETSPVVGVKAPAKEQARERILSDDEIRALWKACNVVGDPYGAAVKVLLLTGARRSEVAGMRRAEIAGDVWSLPPERCKNKQRHDVPLSAQVLALIEAQPEIGDCIFTVTGNTPLNHFDRAKRLLDASMAPAMPWVLHDLRRTCASGMAKLGVKLPVIEKCLNHTSGSFRGIVATYQRHDFAAEKRDALQRWSDHLDAIVRGEPAGKIVTLRRGA
jgi:integrase